MAGAVKESLLKKHIAPPRPVKAAGAGAVEKILAVALPRSADQLLGLQVEIQSVSFGTLNQPGVVAALGECDLICRMSHTSSDPGLIVVDISLLSGLIEVQTLGKVTESPPKERSPTSTDATIVSEIVDRWMTDAADAVSEQGLADELLTDGYLRSDGLLDMRAVDLTLDPGQYRSLVVKMALGGKGKTGTLSFFAPKSATSSGDESRGTLGRQLWAHLLDAPVEMTAVLTRTSRTLDEIMSLKAGDVFPVSSELLQSVMLATSDGSLIATARLGQVGGKRAVRPSVKGNSPQMPGGPDARTIGKALEDLAIGGMATPPQTEAGLSGPEALEPTSAADDLAPAEGIPELPDPEVAVP